MLSSGDRVIAGVSGGADSVCLLFVLRALQERIAFSFGVVHVNHGIRPEAGEDARFVGELCKRLEIPFYLVEKDVPRQAALWKCSEEEAGRRVRYEAFRQIGEEFGASRIAVAHNSNDRAETMLFHLFRGTGLKGLGSIRPYREEIIRPLLCLERKEIEEYLAERDISFCRDATNETDAYTRNRIRHHILPYVEEHIVSGCVPHIVQASHMLSETEDYLEEQTRTAMENCVSSDGRTISVAGLLSCHPVIQKRILYELVKELSPHRQDISQVHIQDLMTLFTKEGSRMICLPFGIRGRREYDRVILERDQEPLLTTGTDMPAGIGLQYEILEGSPEKYWEVPRNEYTKWFDCDKIKKCLILRTRRTGDYLTVTDREGKMIRQSLKDYMINQKIPAGDRDSIPVLADDSHVVWLLGYRISEYYKIAENTKRILQVQLIGARKEDGTEDKDGRAY